MYGFYEGKMLTGNVSLFLFVSLFLRKSSSCLIIVIVGELCINWFLFLNANGVSVEIKKFIIVVG